MHGSAGGNAAAQTGRAGALLPAQRVEEPLPLGLLLGEKADEVRFEGRIEQAEQMARILGASFERNDRIADRRTATERPLRVECSSLNKWAGRSPRPFCFEGTLVVLAPARADVKFVSSRPIALAHLLHSASASSADSVELINPASSFAAAGAVQPEEGPLVIG